MKKEVLELSGIFIFLFGFIFIINYFSGITGYVVINEINQEFNSIAGIVFIVVGLMLFITGRHLQTNRKILVNKKRGIKKIKIALTTKIINYEKLKRLVIESGYKFVEAKDYTTVFSPRDEIIKDENNYPLVIPFDKKNNKELLMKVLKGIVEDYKIM
ncbi:MAG: hypothetical protein ABFQ65_01340 [Nanoarchaeota archaeon]